MNNVFFQLDGELRIFELEKIERVFSIGNRVYRRVSDDNMNGFYDWLRHSVGMIVGIRFNLFEKNSGMLDAIRDFEYIGVEETVGGDSILNIYFKSREPVDESLSADQLFVDDYFYISNDEGYAISVPAPDEWNSPQLRPPVYRVSDPEI
jgi:hypothetical protein